MSDGWPYARPVVSLALAASGVAWVAAARERWWPACPWRDFDSAACARIQDDAYGSIATPWLEAGYTAELQALALALVAVAIAFLPWLWLRRPVAVVALATGAVSVALFVSATWVYLSALAGRPVEGWWFTVPLVVAALGWPLYLFLGLIAALADPYVGVWRPGTGWRLGFWCLLLAGTTLLQLWVVPVVLGYMSYDHTPWADAVSGGLMLCAALVVWPATVSAPARSEPVGGLPTYGSELGHRVSPG